MDMGAILVDNKTSYFIFCRQEKFFFKEVPCLFGVHGENGLFWLC